MSTFRDRIAANTPRGPRIPVLKIERRRLRAPTLAVYFRGLPRAGA